MWAMVVAVVLGVAWGVPSSAQESERRQEWHSRPDLRATLGGKAVTVWQDPLFPYHVVLRTPPRIWIVRLDYQGVSETGGRQFSLEGDRLFYDRTFRGVAGHVIGVGIGNEEKGCPLQCGGACGLPRFEDSRVSFCACDYCAVLDWGGSESPASRTSGMQTAAPPVWEDWRRAQRAEARLGGKPVPLFVDPRFPDHLAIVSPPDCWVVRADQRRTIEADCRAFDPQPESLRFDTRFRSEEGPAAPVPLARRRTECAPFWEEEVKATRPAPFYAPERHRAFACGQWIEIEMRADPP